MKKRCLGLLLSVALIISTLIVPAGAEQVGFPDVKDQDTAVSVEVLRLLGVLDGMGDGTFQSQGTLTRSQFCKMAIHAMYKQEELGLYSSVTVFPDVKPSHWAAGYINMAAKGEKMIAGYPDGKFHPEDPITVGQAVTILVRMLGYKDAELGGVWPDSHVAKASAIGLMNGIDADAGSVLKRGEAAKMFLNLLSAEMAAGNEYMTDLGTGVDAVLVSSSAGSDGKQLETASGTVYTLASGRTASGILNGIQGSLIVKQGKALTFVPEAAGSTKTITVSNCSSNWIIGTDGVKYPVSGKTTTYYSGEETTWGETAAWLHAGTSVTLSSDSAGVVTYIFIGGGTLANQAVIVSADGSSAGFSGLTGGRTDYRIYKNGIPAGVADLKKNDVAIYSAATNTVRVCDTRISVFYESCNPNPTAPEEITVLGGVALNVLPTAQSSIARFKPGQRMTLLMTEDGQVAAAVESSNLVRGNAVGIVTDDGVDLLCGTIRVRLDRNKAANAGKYQGQLVYVSADRRNTITLGRLSGGVGGELNISAKTLGGKKLAENVMIFRDGKDVALSQLTVGVIPATDIVCTRINWAGEVDLIMLKGQDGEAYYGKAKIQTVPAPDEFDENQTVNILQVVYGNDQSSPSYRTGYSARNGQYIAMRIKEERVAGVRVLDAIKSVPNVAWSGKTAVTVAGITYTVPENVLCYNRDAACWVSLSEARAYAETADLYVEDGVVRILEVGV